MNAVPTRKKQLVPVAQQTYRATIIQDMAAFLALADAWQDLLMHSGEQTLNLNHGYLKTWLNHFPVKQLLIILVYNAQGQLVGLAPLEIHKHPAGLGRKLLRHVRFIGSIPCTYDWMKLIVRDGEDEARIIAEIAQQLRKHNHLWDVVELSFVPKPALLQQLAHHLASHCHHYEVVKTMEMPLLPLPRTVEEFSQIVGRKSFKKDLQRVRNILKRDFPDKPLSLHVVDGVRCDVLAVEADLETAFDHHILYWAERGVLSNFKRYPDLREFFKRIFRQFGVPQANQRIAPFWISYLKLGDEIISMHVGISDGDTYYGQFATFDTAYSKYRPGVLHLEELMLYCIENGLSCFNFGRGNQGYKAQWTKTVQTLWTLRLYKTPLSHGLSKMDDLIKKHLLRRKGG